MESVVIVVNRKKVVKMSVIFLDLFVVMVIYKKIIKI